MYAQLHASIKCVCLSAFEFMWHELDLICNHKFAIDFFHAFPSAAVSIVYCMVTIKKARENTNNFCETKCGDGFFI